MPSNSSQRCGDVAMFCLGHGWTPRDGLYGITDQSIDLGLGLHEPISILELSTLDPEMCTIHISESKVNSLRMSIGFCKPRSKSIDQSVGLQCHTARHEVTTHAPNKTSQQRHIFGLKKKLLHPQILNEQFTRTCRNSYLPVTKKPSVL
jgi:hypothetical protein